MRGDRSRRCERGPRVSGGWGAAGVLPEHWRRGSVSAHVRTLGGLVPAGFFTLFGCFIWKIPLPRC